MNDPEPLTKPLSAEDKVILHKLEGKAWFKLIQLYIPLFFMLVFVYLKMQPGGSFRGRPLHYRKSDFETVFPIFASVFSVIFLGFLIRDFRRIVLPFLREKKTGKKQCLSFLAKKYHDPLYDKWLLFYPDKDDYYIQVYQEDFDAIMNGEELYLEVASVTGEVLALKSGSRTFKDPEEFCFSD